MKGGKRKEGEKSKPPKNLVRFLCPIFDFVDFLGVRY